MRNSMAQRIEELSSGIKRQVGSRGTDLFFVLFQLEQLSALHFMALLKWNFEQMFAVFA